MEEERCWQSLASLGSEEAALASAWEQAGTPSASTRCWPAVVPPPGHAGWAAVWAASLGASALPKPDQSLCSLPGFGRAFLMLLGPREWELLL